MSQPELMEITNKENLQKILEEIGKIFDKYALQEGDIITVLAHLERYSIYKQYQKAIAQCRGF